MKIRLTLALTLLTSMAFAQLANDYFKPLKYRNIGPYRGGRSVSATGVIGDPLTYYMGTTGGGLWKTTDGGQRWDNISDGFFEMGYRGGHCRIGFRPKRHLLRDGRTCAPWRDGFLRRWGL